MGLLKNALYILCVLSFVEFLGSIGLFQSKHEGVIDAFLFAGMLSYVWMLKSYQKTKQTLMDQETRYHELFNHINDSIFITEITTDHRWFTFTEVNQAACKRLGYSREELLAMTPADITHPEYVHQFPTARDFFKKGQDTLESVYLSKEGRPITVEVNNRVIPCSGKEYLLSVARDITHRKEIELKLEESRKQFDSLFQYNSDIIFSLDKSGQFININPSGETITGYSKEEMLRLSVLSVVVPEYADLTMKYFYQVLQGNTKSIETVIANKEGKRIVLSVTAVPIILNHQILGVTGIARDITIERQMEMRLKESEQRYRSLFEYNPDAVLSFDLEGNFVSVNPESVKISGYSAEELLKLSFVTLIVPEELQKAIEYFEKAKKGDPQDFQTAIYNKKGNRIELRVKNIPIYIDERIAGVYCIVKDVTQKKRSQKLLDGQSRILEMLAQKKPVSEIYQAIVHLIESLSNGGRCSILLMDKSNTRLIHGSAPNLPAEYIQGIDGICIGPSVGSCGTAAYMKKQVVVSDILTDPFWMDFRDLAHRYGLKACWSTPIFNHLGKVLGTFAMYYPNPCLPDSNDLELIESATYITQLVIQHQEAEEQLNHMAFHDPLTGLPNRRCFELEFHKALEKARQNKSLVALIYLDLDRFKVINDSLGHSAGDLLLQIVARRIQTSLRAGDLIGRQGGDEFLILLEKTTEDEAMKIAQRILDMLSEPIILEGHSIVVTPSIGISIYPTHGEEAEKLIQRADNAMYHAKHLGKNNYQMYHFNQSSASGFSLKIEEDLRKALAHEEFVLHYQPQMDVKTNQIIGVEALIRWNHPEIGIIPPNQFIPIAEEIGLIVPIGEWVLRTACQQNKAWQEEGLPPLLLFVNLSIRQFYQPDLIPMIRNLLDEIGLDPQYLELEITESMTMSIERAAHTIHELKNMGIKIAIDDFGTGYSSLNYLKNLPIDRLKIDQSFVRDIGKEDSKDKDIIATIIAMGHHLKLKVIAEGVEADEQLRFLKKSQCDEAQGYLFSLPLPAEAFQLYHHQMGLCNGET